MYILVFMCQWDSDYFIKGFGQFEDFCFLQNLNNNNNNNNNYYYYYRIIIIIIIELLFRKMLGVRLAEAEWESSKFMETESNNWNESKGVNSIDKEQWGEKRKTLGIGRCEKIDTLYINKIIIIILYI